MISTALRRLLTLAALCIPLLLVGMEALANVPEPPVELRVVVKDGANGTVLNVARLEWTPSKTGADEKAFNVYLAAEADPNGNVAKFRIIGSTEQNGYSLENLSGGTYAAYVTAYNASGESAPSNTVYFKLPYRDSSNTGGPARIKFTTYPNNQATLGAEYLYDADAVASVGGEIRYQLLPSPLGAPTPEAEGMTIDPMTGVARWTPTMEGTFVATIGAYLVSDSTVREMQIAIITVAKPACAVIHGRVNDTTGTPVRDGIVMAVRLDASAPTDPKGGRSAIYGKIFEGSYALPAQEGVYAVRAEGAGFMYQWYRNAKELVDAERITVGCGDSVPVDFTVAPIPQPTWATTVGKVISKENGTPVMAIVEFIPRDPSGRPSPNDPATGTVYPDRFVTKTDMDGVFTIELNDQLNYIVHAIPVSEDYLPQYFNGVSTEAEATVYNPMTDVAIVFALESRPVYPNSISGTVRSAAGIGLYANVIAMRTSAAGPNGEPRKDYARTVETDREGAYIIKNLEPGEYVLLASPASRDFVPGYYSANDLAALSWVDATRISVDDAMVAMQYDITLRARNGAKGVAKLRGVVNVGPGSTKRGSTTKSSEVLPGVFVYALDSKNAVSDYTFSDAGGYFELNELSVGQYTIIADKAGYGTVSVNTELDYEGRSNVEKDLAMSPQAPSRVDDEPAAARLTLYPNPASSRLTLEFTGRAGTATVEIVDALGATVSTSRIATIDGANRVTLGTQDLRPGTYVARIVDGSSASAIPFTIVR